MEETLQRYFAETYGMAGPDVKRALEMTEPIARKILFANEYYFSQLSMFPDINHSKNHFYFELLRENYKIAPNKWFVPVGYIVEQPTAGKNTLKFTYCAPDGVDSVRIRFDKISANMPVMYNVKVQ